MMSNRENPTSASVVDMAIGSRLTELRTREGLSRDDVASQIGVDSSTYLKMERGELRIGANEIVALSLALNTEIAAIFSQERSTASLHFGKAHAPSAIVDLVERFKTNRGSEPDE